MAITLTAACAMCGENLPVEIRIQIRYQLLYKSVKKSLESKGWIVQDNAGTIDVYCSEECAK